MTKKKAMVSTYGLMVDGMKVSGRMGSSTEKGNSLIVKAKVKEEYGKTARDSSG